MSRYIETIQLENKVLKQIWQQDSDDDDVQEAKDFPIPFRFAEIYPEDVQAQKRAEAESENQYMGGQKERRKFKSVYGKPKKKTRIQRFLTSIGLGTPEETPQEKWEGLSKEDKQKRIEELWDRARRYGNKLRFESRLKKMADSNLKEMMIDDINEDANDANLVADSQTKIKWYLIDTEKSFCKVWNFIISMLIIYELFVVPFVLVFPDIYNTITEVPKT